jgi:hypothetical protein
MDHRDGHQAASFPEVEAPDPRPADELPRATAAWDASACARRDAAMGAADLRPQLAGGVERWAGLARDVPARDATCRRLEPRAAPAAKPPAEAPCRPVAARFAERSSAAPEVAEQPGAPQGQPLAGRSPKPPAVFPRKDLVLLAAAPGVPTARPQATMPPEAQRMDVQKQPEPLAAGLPALPEMPLPASSPEAPPPQVFLPELVALLDAALPAAPQLPSAA